MVPNGGGDRIRTKLPRGSAMNNLGRYCKMLGVESGVCFTPNSIFPPNKRSKMSVEQNLLASRSDVNSALVEQEQSIHLFRSKLRS